MDFFQTALTDQYNSELASSTYLLCESAHNKQIFKKEKRASLEKLIRSINSELSVSDKKYASIAQLLTLLPQCDKQTFSLEGERWIRLCLQKLKGDDATQVPQLLAVITYVLRRCHNNKDLLNQISKLNGQFLPQLYSVEPEFRKEACKCLLQFLLLLPHQALQHKTKIEKMVVQFLGRPLSPFDEDVVNAAKVFAALPVPGSGGGAVGQLKHGRLDQLISLGHAAMDVIFSGVHENETYQFPRNHKLPFKALESALSLNQPIRSIFTATPILCNVFIFIREFFQMTNLEYSPKELVGFAIRALQVEMKTLKQSSIENRIVSLVLPSIHSRALEFLKSMVQNNVFGMCINLVEEQVVTTLVGTNQSDCQSGKERSSDQEELASRRRNISIKSQCYQTLSEIIKVTRGCHSASVEGILSTLVEDILPTKDNAISLKRATRGARLSLVSARKKSKKKGYTVASEEEDSAIGSNSPDTASLLVPTTLGALELIESLFLHAQDVITPKVVRTLNKHLTNILQTPKVGVYAVPEVKSSLYSALIAYALYPHPLCPPSYVMLHHALEEGARDSDPLVSQCCMRGLATLSFAMANPSVASLSFGPKRHDKIEGDQGEEEEETGIQENGEASEEAARGIHRPHSISENGVETSDEDCEEEEEEEEEGKEEKGNESLEHDEKEDDDNLGSKEEGDTHQKLSTQNDFISIDVESDEDSVVDINGDDEEDEAAANVEEERDTVSEDDDVSVEEEDEPSSEEENVICLEESKKNGKADTSVRKRKNEKVTPGKWASKKLRAENEQETDASSLAEMLGSFVCDDPDSFSD